MDDILGGARKMETQNQEINRQARAHPGPPVGGSEVELLGVLNGFRLSREHR